MDNVSILFEQTVLHKNRGWLISRFRLHISMNTGRFIDIINFKAVCVPGIPVLLKLRNRVANLSGYAHQYLIPFGG